MRLTALALVGTVASVVSQPALADTCMVRSSRAAGEWTFIKVYDADTGKVVLQQVITGGVDKEVTVSRHRVRVDWKLAGDIDYRPGPTSICKAGNRIKI